MEEIVVRNRIEFEKKLTTKHLLNSFNVYCRVSTKDQIDNTSLDNQMELGINYVNKNHSNKLMRLRVLFQAIAVLVFVIIIWLSRN